MWISCGSTVFLFIITFLCVLIAFYQHLMRLSSIDGIFMRLTRIFYNAILIHKNSVKRGEILEVYERIKILRKEILNLRQEEFAAKLNISRGNISNIEIDRVKVTDRVISDICSEFNVSENWLRNGEGEVFEELTEQQKIMKYTAMLLKDTDSIIADAIKNFIVTYEQLDDSSKKVLEDVAKKYINNINKNKRPV